MGLMICGRYFSPNVDRVGGETIYFINVIDKRVSFYTIGINQFLRDKFKEDGFILTGSKHDMLEIKHIFDETEEVDRENITERLDEISKKWGIVNIKVEI